MVAGERERCEAIVKSSSQCLPRQCRRPATWSTLTRDGRTVRECSRHHARDAGVWRMLAPHPWDIVSEVELASARTDSRSRVGRAMVDATRDRSNAVKAWNAREADWTP